MAQWNVQHRVFVYDAYVKNSESVTKTQRLFRVHFNVGRHGNVPDRNTILRWVNNFRSTGSVTPRKPPGAIRTVRTPDNIDRVRAAILRSPRRSVRKHAAALRMTNSSVRRILRTDLKFHPYKLAIVQELGECDYTKRSQFSESMLNILRENDNVVIMMSDEAHFHLNGSVNKQNSRYWAMNNPQQLHQKPLHSPRVTVWCAVSKFGVIGPYFFEEHGATVTVTSDRYINMITNFFLPELQRGGIDIGRIWFQQDGATAHTARASMRVLREIFEERVISRFGDVPWPPRSPDLSVCDFFLWGFLKSRVYEDKPRTLEHLKIAIRREVQRIDRALLEDVMNNFEKRLEICIRERGRHLSDVIFRT